jgi:penicillin-binding protein 2
MSRKQREEERVRAIFGRRALLVGVAQMGLLGVLAHRLHRLQVEEGERYATLAEENRLSARLLAPPRGRVLDRDGRVIAGNQLNWRALLVAEQTADVGATLETFGRIVPISDQERARIEREVRRRRRFVPVTVREFLTWEEMARIELNAPDLPGIAVDVGTTRIYPEGEHMATSWATSRRRPRPTWTGPAAGAAGHPHRRAGIERHHDRALRGHAGAVQLEVNAVGRVIRELDRREGTPGQDVQLSVDAGLQRAIRERIEEGTSVVLMDARMARCWHGEPARLRPQPVQRRRLGRAVARVDAQPRHAPDQQGDERPLCPGLHLQDGGGAGGAGGAGGDAGRPRALPRPHGPRRCALPLLAPAGPWRRRHAPGAQGLLRRLLLRDGQAHRHRPDRRNGAALRARRAARDRAAGHPAGLVPDRAWRQAQGKPWALGDTVVHGIGRASTSSRRCRWPP